MSIKRNFVFNSVLTGVYLLTPLIVFPYVARTLGAEHLGKVNFYSAGSEWISVLAMLSIPIYGVREISKSRDDRQKLQQTFSELCIILCASIILFSTLAIFGFLFSSRIQQEPVLFAFFLSQSIFLTLSFEWVFGGLEKYDYIAVRSLVIKALYIVAVIMFVRQRSDYMVFAGLTFASTAISMIVNIFSMRKLVSFGFSGINIRRHIRPISILFLCILVGSIYSKGDMVFVGFLSSDQEVGYYSMVKKVSLLAITVTGTISLVLIPRLSYLHASGNADDYQEVLRKSFRFLVLTSIPMSIGVALFSGDISLILGGGEFSAASRALCLIAPVVVAANLSGFVGNQYFLPRNRESMILLVTGCGAIVNLVSNILLIPRYGHVGATLAIVGSESVVAAISLALLGKKNISKLEIPKLWTYAVGSLLATATVLFASKFTCLSGNNSHIITGTLIFSTIYVLWLLALKDEIIWGALQFFFRKKKSLPSL